MLSAARVLSSCSVRHQSSSGDLSDEEHVPVQVKVSAQQAQNSVKQSAAQLRGKAGKAAAPTESEKKGGPLSWLGFGQETVYADDD